jgi:hypothetical protein
MSNQKVRTLTQLEKNASTARVMNLRAIYYKNLNNPEYVEHPLFNHPTLNRAILVKHRIRDNERYDFALARTTATKVIIPIDPENLNAGGQYAFVGQINFAKIIADTLSVDMVRVARDIEILTLIDQCNSLDPFLLREHLGRQGVKPAQCYFDVTESDNGKMLSFTKEEIAPLVNKSIGKMNSEMFTEILSRKLLADYADDILNPLRETLQMDTFEFREGVFCWKAFLYYKWQLRTLKPVLPKVMLQINRAEARGLADQFTTNQIERLKRSIRRRMGTVLHNVQDIISVYDRAYAELVRGNDPQPFRTFLLSAPRLFNALGERLGAIEHVSTYWTHRTQSQDSTEVMVDELVEMFADFDHSLTLDAIVG